MDTIRLYRPGQRDWSAPEREGFDRLAAALQEAGRAIVCEVGLSDEGDPWAIFVREDRGDVIAHVARIDDRFVAALANTDEPFWHRDLCLIMRVLYRNMA